MIDVWDEAAQASPPHQGTSFLLRILPYMEGDNLASGWNYSFGVSSTTINPGTNVSNFSIANTNVATFYCPTRRSKPGATDMTLFLNSTWTGGGTDYGGCVGRHLGFDVVDTYPACKMCDTWFLAGAPPYGFIPKPLTLATDQQGYMGQTPPSPPPVKRWGIFGKPNVATRFGDVTDGLSRTIMTGELVRVLAHAANTPTGTAQSHDGWAIGDISTLFSAGILEFSDSALRPPD